MPESPNGIVRSTVERAGLNCRMRWYSPCPSTFAALNWWARAHARDCATVNSLFGKSKLCTFRLFFGASSAASPAPSSFAPLSGFAATRCSPLLADWSQNRVAQALPRLGLRLAREVGPERVAAGCENDGDADVEGDLGGTRAGRRRMVADVGIPSASLGSGWTAVDQHHQILACGDTLDLRERIEGDGQWIAKLTAADDVRDPALRSQRRPRARHRDSAPAALIVARDPDAARCFAARLRARHAGCDGADPMSGVPSRQEDGYECSRVGRKHVDDRTTQVAVQEDVATLTRGLDRVADGRRRRELVPERHDRQLEGLLERAGTSGLGRIERACLMRLPVVTAPVDEVGRPHVRVAAEVVTGVGRHSGDQGVCDAAPEKRIAGVELVARTQAECGLAARDRARRSGPDAPERFDASDEPGHDESRCRHRERGVGDDRGVRGIDSARDVPASEGGDGSREVQAPEVDAAGGLGGVEDVVVALLGVAALEVRGVLLRLQLRLRLDAVACAQEAELLRSQGQAFTRRNLVGVRTAASDRYRSLA